MNLPNKLTLFRVILVPFYIWAYIKEMFVFAIIIFSIAAITDSFDGMLARKGNLITNFGKIMDPLADKILVYSAFILLCPIRVKNWMLILIFIREFLISGIRTVAASNGKIIAAGISGKIKTFIQMVCVPVILLSMELQDSNVLYYISQILLYLSLVLTVFSGIEYTIKNKEVFKN